jgi:hypothetical protein
MNRCCIFVEFVHDNACVGRFVVDNKTKSFSLKTSLCFLPFLSACSFCVSTASAIASRTYRRIICLVNKNLSIASCSRFDILLMSFNSLKLASIDAEATVSSEEEVSIDERRESEVSPPIKVESRPKRREGTRGCRA